MITAGRQRRVLPWGKGGRQGLENSDGGRGYAPSAPTRGETFWLLLQQKQQTGSMPQSAWNENLPWTSDSKKWVSKLEEAARFRQPVPWHLIRIMLLSVGASAQPQLPPTRRGWISPVTCIMGCFASYPPSMLPAFVSASSVGCSVLFWGSEWLSQGQATWLTRWCHSPGVKMDGLPIHRALRAHPTSCRAAVPNLFGTRDLFHGRQFFSMDWGLGGTVSGWFKYITYYISGTVSFYYYYYISSISDHQGLDLRGWDSPTRLSPEDMVPKNVLIDWQVDGRVIQS